MNIDALLDDLEATFNQLTSEEEKLVDRKPIGYNRVTFGKDHFTGLAATDDSWHLVAYSGNQVIVTEPGESNTSDATINRQAHRLINLWLRVDLGESSFRGRLLSVENRLLVFREVCVPVANLRRIELHAVDNQTHD
jgi:hypothetical protein